jgi:hypothetical protein
VFVDLRHCEKALAQNTKTTFFKKHFLTAKHRLNTVKHCLLVEKDRATHVEKIRGKKSAVFFWRIFQEVSIFAAPAVGLFRYQKKKYDHPVPDLLGRLEATGFDQDKWRCCDAHVCIRQ